MSTIKRRDNKNRILNNNESQRRDGRYAYKYTDVFGKVKFVYSWKLVSTDTTPKGKKDDLSLREKEKLIQKDILDGIDTTSKNMTVMELVEKYVSQKRNLKYLTEVSYKYVVRYMRKHSFSMRKIETVKKSDVKQFLIDLKDSGYAYNSINNLRKILRPAFEMAVEDNLIRSNPFNFHIDEILKNDSEKRRALTDDEVKTFLECVKTYEQSARSKYYEDVVILLNTGLRISELCGLTLNDLDFENRKISINKQLIKTKQMEYMVTTLKTKNSYREIPMTDIVYQSLQNIIEYRRKPIINEIDGYSDFVFIDYYGKPKVASHYHCYFKDVITKYNACHSEQIPTITPHVLRHTYCTNMALKGINPKALQYLMGHSDINITLNLYTHATIDNVFCELQRLKML